MAALSYWLLVHKYGELTPGEGKALITSVLVAHAVLSDLVGLPLDFTAPFAHILHAVTLVPAGPGGEKTVKSVKVVANGKGEGKKDK